MKLTSPVARRTAAFSLAAVAALGITGCSAINYQATTHTYSPSDGVMHDADDVVVRGLSLITADQGEPARIIGMVRNTAHEGTSRVELSVSGESFSFTIPAGESVNLEHDQELIIESGDTAPGDYADVEISVDGNTETVRATVLNGGIAEYRHLLPDEFDDASVEHLIHGPDTYGGGTAHHDPDDDGH